MNAKKILFLFVALILIFGAATAFADTVVETTTTSSPRIVYWQHGDSLLGNIFYLLGDIVALPFRLVGSIFDAIF